MTRKQAIAKIAKANKLIESVHCGMTDWIYTVETAKTWSEIRGKLTDAQVNNSMAITRLEQNSFWS